MKKTKHNWNVKYDEPVLLERREFKRAVFKRDGNQCVFCQKEAVDAHHIMDRSLFKSGGFYLDNGASVCEDCHWDCEKSFKYPDDIRKAAGISNVILPIGLNQNRKYDKWGKDVGRVPLNEGKTPRHTVLLP